MRGARILPDSAQVPSVVALVGSWLYLNLWSSGVNQEGSDRDEMRAVCSFCCSLVCWDYTHCLRHVRHELLSELHTPPGPSLSSFLRDEKVRTGVATFHHPHQRTFFFSIRYAFVHTMQTNLLTFIQTCTYLRYAINMMVCCRCGSLNSYCTQAN